MAKQSRCHVVLKVKPLLVMRGDKVIVSGKVSVPKQEMRVDIMRCGENVGPGGAAKPKDTKKFTTDEKGQFGFVLNTKSYVSGHYFLKFYCSDEDPAEIFSRKAFEVMRPSEFKKLIKDLDDVARWVLS